MSTKLDSIQDEHEPLLTSELFGSNDEIGQFIAENAYYKAEKRGFEPGYEVHDWVQSERDILTLNACPWSY